MEICSNDMKQFQRRVPSHRKHKLSISARKLFGKHCEESTSLLYNYHNEDRKRDSTIPVEKFSDECFTFRLEHIEGGPLAQHLNEERLVLFRSDKAGAIGKIVFSASHIKDIKNESGIVGLVSLTIHTLEVKKLYRGHDLGRFLFSQVISLLSSSERNKIHRKVIINGQLDAEEDITRHNKLVRFYKSLGCYIKDSPSSSSIQYIHHQDRVFRKIPLCFECEYTSSKDKFNEAKKEETIPFLPIRFIYRNELTAVMNLPSNLSSCSLRPNYWLIYFVSQENISLDRIGYDSSSVIVEFRTTLGQTLSVSPQGELSLSSFTKTGDIYPQNRFNSKFIFHKTDAYDKNNTHGVNSWNIQSLTTQKAFYLSVDPMTSELTCDQFPSSWIVDQQTSTLRCYRSNDEDPSIADCKSNSVIQRNVGTIGQIKQIFLQEMKQ